MKEKERPPANVIPIARELKKRYKDKKYFVEGMVNAPARRSVRMRSVWLIEKNSVTLRLITAYPAPELRGGK